MTPPSPTPEAAGLAARIEAIDGARLASELEERGHAVVEGLLDRPTCEGLANGMDDASAFRKRVVMQEKGYGRGEYRYFAYPLPPVVETLRTALYPRLVGTANRWSEALGSSVRFPDTHPEYLERCHAAGQARPTPLLLAYGPGDYNRLHQDLYGEHVFPLQAAVLLAEPGRDFEGGEFVLTEQRPRMQARPMVVPLRQGDAVVFAVEHRPVPGPRGPRRMQMRHGVSELRAGRRHTLGVIFHDAE